MFQASSNLFVVLAISLFTLPTSTSKYWRNSIFFLRGFPLKVFPFTPLSKIISLFSNKHLQYLSRMELPKTYIYVISWEFSLATSIFYEKFMKSFCRSLQGWKNPKNLTEINSHTKDKNASLRHRFESIEPFQTSVLFKGWSQNRRRCKLRAIETDCELLLFCSISIE